MSCCRRRFSVISLGVTALLGGLTGCSTHPVPEDFSRASTVDIVKSIRCEALAGLESLYDELTPAQRAKAAPIVNASMIGYDFTFTLHETNHAGGPDAKDGLVKFQRAFTSPSSTLDVTGKAELDRLNTRTFTIIEPLMELAKSRDICRSRTKGTNWTYPIAGTIGLDEIVRTYIKLELLSELQEDKGKVTKDVKVKVKAVPPDKDKEVPANVVFSDEVQFTTTFTAGASGTLVLDAVVGRVSVTNASVGVGASRSDTHKVVVALTRTTVDVDERVKDGKPAPGKTKAGANKTRPKETAREERERMIKDGSVRDPRAQARLIQMNSNAQDSIAIELHRRRSFNDKDEEAARALGQRLLDLLKLP